MDLQIGEKIEGGFMETHSKGKGAELGLTAGAASSQGSETGKSTNKSTVTSEVIKQKSHLKHAQRIIVTTKGRRMPEEVARQAVQDKLPEAVRKQMPRIGRRS
jgi:hypothetical protein